MNLYTVAQAAELLGVQARTVRTWIATGRLTASRLSPRCTRITEAAVERLLETGEQPAPATSKPRRKKAPQRRGPRGCWPVVVNKARRKA